MNVATRHPQTGEDPSPRPGPLPAAVPAPADPAPVNLLLVDDDARNLDVLESILQSPSYKLIRAQTADDTLMALIQKDVAAIVLDIQMPGMNGFELARMIKQRRRNQLIPILFLTAYFNDSKDVLSGYDVGAVDYLTKPVDPQILRSKVSAFVELFRTNRALAAANESLEREIAERKRVELELSRVAAIVESSSDAILSRSFGGTITSWNSGAERMFGYAAAEVIGQSIAILLGPGRESEVNFGNEAIKRGQTVASIETVRRHKDGRLIDVSLACSAIKDMTGRIMGISSIMRDISERKRLESEVLQAAEYEQQRIADDLHDGLGQQLAGISCLSESLKTGLERKKLSQAADAAKISKLLDVAVAQTRVLARGLHPVISEPNGLMSALEEMTSHAADLFKVSCRFECPEPAWLDDNFAATHLYRIAQEAVTNAIKHGHAREIRVQLSLTSGRIILKVSDNGAGFRPDGQRQRGMGLRIMEHRASVIGGTLRVQPGTQGVEVTCVLDRHKRQETA